MAPSRVSLTIAFWALPKDWAMALNVRLIANLALQRDRPGTIGALACHAAVVRSGPFKISSGGKATTRALKFGPRRLRSQK